MRVLSLFDGISCARVALEKAGIPVQKYFASEIDTFAIQIAQKNWPDTVQLGSVTNIDVKREKKNRGFLYDDSRIDLLIGGSPCQDLSIAKKNRKGLEGDKSSLFWDFIRILEEVKPKYFVLENVASMDKSQQEIISKTLGVQPILIDAGLLSAQTRKRLFWTNIPNVIQPEDKEIYLRDILEDVGIDITERVKSKIKGTLSYKKTYSNLRTIDEKAKTLTASGQNISNSGATNIFIHEDELYLAVREATKKGYAIAKDGDSVDLSFPNSKTRRGRVGKKAKNLMTQNNINVFTKATVRKLTPVECERLQCLPDNYTGGVSGTQRYKALGNAFNADVVAHLLSFVPKLDKR